MHIPHINRFTIARAKNSLGAALLGSVLAMLSMAAILPLANGAHPIVIAGALVVIVAMFAVAVAL